MLSLRTKAKYYLYYNPNTHYIMLYTQFQKKTHQLHLTCWYALGNTGDFEWMLWMIKKWILWCGDDENEMQLKI